MVYYSRVHKHPDFENNQGAYKGQRLVISEQNDAFFSYEAMHLGVFSDTGGAFQIQYSFKVEIA